MKFCLFLSICISLTLSGLSPTGNPRLEILDPHGRGTYAIYSAEDISSPLITYRTDLGFSYIYTLSPTHAAIVRALFTHIDGESLTLQNPTLTPGQILRTLGYHKVSASISSGPEITYAYSNRGQAFIRANNQRVNLQIAATTTQITIGWPVILGPY